MEWAITHDAGSGIVQARARGTVTSDHSDRMMSELLAAAGRLGSLRLLVDLTDAEMGMQVADIHARPRRYAAMGMPSDARLAVVFREWTPDAVFFETTLLRETSAWRVFVSVDEAASWLSHDGAAPVQPRPMSRAG